jgi:hypothetical protein
VADYDQYGNPIPPADAQAARVGTGTGTASSISQDSSDPTSPDYVSPDVVTITAPAQSSLLGLAIIVGLLYFLMRDSHGSAHEDE